MKECIDSGSWVPPQYRFGDKGWCGNCGGYVRITAKTETDYPRYTAHKMARKSHRSPVR